MRLVRLLLVLVGFPAWRKVAVIPTRTGQLVELLVHVSRPRPTLVELLKVHLALLRDTLIALPAGWQFGRTYPPMNEATPLTWTTAAPTVPGWYWFRRPGSSPECVEVVPFSYPIDDDMRAQVVGRDDWFGLGDWYFAPTVGQWAGPIALPDAAAPQPPRLGGKPPELRT